MFFVDAGTFSNGHYGLLTPLGHADFYPSNGYNQPFCSAKVFYRQLRRMKRMTYAKLFRTVDGMQTTCDHRMSIVYLVHSTTKKMQYLACTENVLQIDCNYMGFDAKKPTERKSYFIPTESLPLSFI